MHFNHLRCLLLLALPLCGCLYSSAAPINVDSLMKAQRKESHQIPRMMVGYEFNINDADDVTFSHEIDFHWYFLKYFGLGFGAELDTNNTNTSLYWWMNDDHYDDDYYRYEPDDITKINFHPMLSFRSPTLWFSHDRSWGLMLRCDPGLVMSLPANDHVWISPNDFPPMSEVPVEGNVKVSNHGGKWLFYRMRTALSVYNEFGMFSVGWSFSDYNINYCRNNMVYKGHKFYHHDGYSNTGTLFFALSVCF